VHDAIGEDRGPDSDDVSAGIRSTWERMTPLQTMKKEPENKQELMKKSSPHL
jgi:hypothetical protein